MLFKGHNKRLSLSVEDPVSCLSSSLFFFLVFLKPVRNTHFAQAFTVILSRRAAAAAAAAAARCSALLQQQLRRRRRRLQRQRKARSQQRSSSSRYSAARAAAEAAATAAVAAAAAASMVSPGVMSPDGHLSREGGPQGGPQGAPGQQKVLHFKLVLLGDTSVGKSCLVVRFAKDEFYEYQESTIGAAFMTQSVDLGDCIVKFEIWDTAGQERYRSLAPMYYRQASRVYAAAVIVYDTTSRESFEGAKSWVAELQAISDKSSLVMALAGNKTDLAADRVVKTQEAQQFAEEQGIFFLETSAKTGKNVNELFYEIARQLPKSRREQDPHAGFQINKKTTEKKSGCAAPSAAAAAAASIRSSSSSGLPSAASRAGGGPRRQQQQQRRSLGLSFQWSSSSSKDASSPAAAASCPQQQQQQTVPSSSSKLSPAAAAAADSLLLQQQQHRMPVACGGTAPKKPPCMQTAVKAVSPSAAAFSALPHKPPHHHRLGAPPYAAALLLLLHFTL
ncbi:hypothetical protein Esti_006097 [Eimeria stiedai]